MSLAQRVDAPTCIYAPTLHRQLAPQGLPQSVCFLFPGLSGVMPPEGAFTPADLPLPPALASAVLAELLQLGENGNAAADMAVAHAILPDREKADLASFVADGGGKHADNNRDTPLIGAHKVLLLSWDLEERLIELETLREQVRQAAAPLEESLRDPATAGEDAPGLAAVRDFLDLSEVGFAEPDWRITLTALAAFLPENAVLVTAHREMCAALREAGMLQPLPGDIAEDLATWPPALLSVCLWVHGAPLWRIAGYTKPREAAPWLNAAPEIIVCPPDAIVRAV